MKNVMTWIRKQVLAIVIYGGIFLVIMGAMFAYALYVGTKLDASSKRFAIESIGGLSKRWDVSSLKALATPNLLEQIIKNPDEFAQGMHEVSTLVRLENVDQIEGHAFVRYMIGEDNSTTASYQANATFGTGKAYISMCLELMKDQWRVNCITVNKSE